MSRERKSVYNATYGTYALNRQVSKSCSLFQYPTKMLVIINQRAKLSRVGKRESAPPKGDVHRARQDITG